jgi:hypothetical protein
MVDQLELLGSSTMEQLLSATLRLVDAAADSLGQGWADAPGVDDDDIMGE